jgi:membrane protein DedA with SNARE-associated domain
MIMVILLVAVASVVEEPVNFAIGRDVVGQLFRRMNEETAL